MYSQNTHNTTTQQQRQHIEQHTRQKKNTTGRHYISDHNSKTHPNVYQILGGMLVYNEIKKSGDELADY